MACNIPAGTDPKVKYMILEMWLIKMHQECLIIVRDFDSKDHRAVVEYNGEIFHVDLGPLFSVYSYDEFRERLLNLLKEMAEMGMGERISNIPRWLRPPNPCGRKY